MNTVRVRIAVAVAPNGCWSCSGGKLMEDWEHGKHEDERNADGASSWTFKQHGRGHVVYVEAEVPVPDPMPETTTIEGKVTA